MSKKDKSKQQKPKSKTAKTIQVPKPEEKEKDQDTEPANLCDDCAYQFGECDGKPTFASDLDPELTGEAADRVVKCEGFVNVGSMPTKEELQKQGPDAAHDADDQVQPKPWDLALGRLDDFGQAILNSRADEIRAEAERRYEGEEPSAEDMAGTLVLIVQDIIEKEGGRTSGVEEEEKEKGADELPYVPAPPPDRPDPKRFLEDQEDYGSCPSCNRPLKRTAYNRYQDAVRCTNPRCRSYRAVLKLISTGVK
jgi:hypothetical protein